MTPRDVLRAMCKKATTEFDQKAKLTEYHKKYDAELAKEAAKKKKDEEGLTEKDKKIKAFFSREPFGCNNDEAVELVEILIGKKLNIESSNDQESIDEKSPQISENSVPLWTMLVCVLNPNEHDYGTEPAMVIEGDADERLGCLLKMSGSTGNHTPQGKASLRVATEAEIDRYFATISGRALKRYIDDEILNACEAVAGSEDWDLKRPRKKAAKKKAAKKAVAKKKAVKKKKVARKR